MKNLFFTLIFLLVSLLSFSQKEAAVWYFGNNAGLDFNSGTPVPLTNGAMVTREGCASISDYAGNLLFYTDGEDVWNRNHQLMPNGSGLLGDFSSTQSSIVIPRPNSANIYYIFTVDEKAEPDGLRYSELDINLNGGLGDITGVKNAPLFTPVTEKLTAVLHANGTDIWVLAHGWNTNTFLAYLVTSSGVQTTPIVSNIGLIHQVGPTGGAQQSGYMKASPDGSKVAVAMFRIGVELFDFDSATGILNNNRVFSRDDNGDYYGLEFSPNSQLLYRADYGGEVYQYDLTAPDVATTEILIYSSNPNEFPFGGLQMGINGKIYMAQEGADYLSSIENPNELGVACNFVEQSVNLSGRISRLGLPPFIQSFFLVTFTAQNLCMGDSTQFNINATEPVLSSLWDFGDGNISNMENPTHTYGTAGTYIVSVTVTTASETKTETREITINETPIANAPTDLVGCTSYGSYNLDMPSFDSAVLGTQDPNDFKVDYFLTQADADGNVNALSALHSFDYGTTPVFVRVTNNSNSLCYDTTQFNIIAREAPLVDSIADWTVCDDDEDGLFTFDLSTKNIEIFDGQDETKFEILYFASQADADTGTNPLPLNYTNTASTEKIFIRFQNSTYPTCFRTGSFNIEVLDGVIANSPTNLEVCDDNNDGQSIFDLTQTEAEIIGAQGPNNLNISFHETQADADTGLNVVNAQNYLSTSYQNTVYVRVENASDSSCYDTTSFDLNIFDTPVAPTLTDWQVCDDNNDGQFIFDFTQMVDEIIAGDNGLSVSFYTNLTDADAAQNRINGDFENSVNPQTVYFRLENANNPNCYARGDFDLHVFDSPTAYVASDFIICDMDESGVYSFDLSQKDAEVLNGQDATTYTVSYHAAEQEAYENLNPLLKNGYQNSNYNETLWARVQHIALNSCYDISSFNLIINPLPQPVLEERYVICPDSPELVIDGGDFESWSWQGLNGMELSSSRTVDIEDLGEYQLTISQTTNGITCENSVSFEVLSSGAPESLKVETNGFSDQIDVTVNATGTGPFEYSVDGENYQVSNEFKVFPGKYTVYVRDLEECRILSEEIIAIGYQRFFTPNGDGSNEYWNIIGGELYPESQLFIYDRYGKLLAQVDPNSNGWDGRLNGAPLPESDYWFSYSFSDDKTVTGHFSLKR